MEFLNIVLNFLFHVVCVMYTHINDKQKISSSTFQKKNQESFSLNSKIKFEHSIVRGKRFFNGHVSQS